MYNSARCRYLMLFLTFGVLTATLPALSPANELLRIAGMGGTRIATSADDAGPFGNPASVVYTTHHNVALGISLEDLYWTELPKSGTEQLVAETGIDISPGLYYSYVFSKWGVSAGYTVRSANFANFTLERTDSEYNRNQRQFTAKTDFITDYNLRQEQTWLLGFSREFKKVTAGARFKWVKQTVDRGTLVSTVNLAARHGPEVDVDIPEELVAAITEELQFGDRVREIVHVRQSFLDRTVRRLELDIGFQREVWLDPQHTHPPLQVGVLFENLLRADLVEPFPFRLGIGVAYEPLKRVTVAADLWRDIGQRDVGFAIGGELYKMWSGEIPKSVALRVGTGRSDATAYASVGAGVRIGTTYLEYSAVLGDFAYESVKHLFAFTLRF